MTRKAVTPEEKLHSNAPTVSSDVEPNVPAPVIAAEEVVEAPAPAEEVETYAVTMAYNISVKGKEYAPDETAELPIPVARDLVQAGRARWAEKEE